MHRKVTSIGLPLALMLLTVVVVAATAEPASARGKALRYRIVRHARSYDLVRGHHRVLRVRHNERYVTVRGLPRYRVVKRRHRSILLRRTSAAVVKASTNTAILRAVLASVGLPSSASSTRAGSSPAAGNDGLAATSWTADSSSYPQWWMVDLGSVTTLSGVEADWSQAAKRAYRYRIQVSLDGTSFATVKDRSRNQTRGATTDALTAAARYVRVEILGVSGTRVPASADEITVYAAALTEPPAPDPGETPDATPTATPTAAPSAPTTASPTPTPTTAGPVVTGLSAGHAAAGTSLTITGSGFGAPQGASSVTFGERTNAQGWAACARQAKVTTWSDTQITVTVPSMSPGKAGEPDTYHPLYVTVGGVMSNSVDFFLDPAIVYSGRTFSTASLDGNRIPAGHDVLYDGCTFTATSGSLPGPSAGVVLINGYAGAHYDITFNDCTFVRNMGKGSDNGQEYGVNGVKILDDANNTHDLTFAGCTFQQFSRFAFEAVCAGYPQTTYGLERIGIVGCTFQPAGSEAISFACYEPLGNHQLLVKDTVIEGWDCLSQGWGGGAIEFMGQGMQLDNVQIWAGGGPIFNFEGVAGKNPSLFYARSVTTDNTRVSPLQNGRVNQGSSCFCSWGSSDSQGRVFRVNSSLWQDCSFNVQGLNYCINAPWGYLSDANNNVFTRSVFTGKPNTYSTSSPEHGYVFADATCTGNLWPAHP